MTTEATTTYRFQRTKRLALLQGKLPFIAIALCSCVLTQQHQKPIPVIDSNLPIRLVSGTISEVKLPPVLQSHNPIGVKQYRPTHCLRDIADSDFVTVYEWKTEMTVVIAGQWSNNIRYEKRIEFHLVNTQYQLTEEMDVYYRIMPWKFKGYPETRRGLTIHYLPTRESVTEIFAYNADGSRSTIGCHEIDAHLKDIERDDWAYGR